MRLNLSIFTVLIAISILAVGCQDHKDNNLNEETILKPVAEHLCGKWLMTVHRTFVNGKWEENENDENVSMVMDLRPDGSEVRVLTFPDGYTSLATTTWSVDEITGIFTDNGPLKLIKLTESEFIMEGETVIDPGTGESSAKKADGHSIVYLNRIKLWQRKWWGFGMWQRCTFWTVVNGKIRTEQVIG